MGRRAGLALGVVVTVGVRWRIEEGRGDGSLYDNAACG